MAMASHAQVIPLARPVARGLSRRAAVLAPLFAAVSLRPATARAERLPLIAYLGPETPERFESRLRAFRAGLAEAGLSEGRTVRVDYRWAEGRYERLPALARELAGLDPDVFVATGGAQATLAARAVAEGRSVVFEMGGDPVQLGVVESLSRPGANLTGVSSLSVEVSRKRLAFLHEACPAARRLVAAVNPASPTATAQVTALRLAAAALPVGLGVVEVCGEADLASLFATAAAGGDAVVFTSDPYFAFRSELLGELARRHRVAAITQSRDFPIAGGLMSYGGDFMQSHRHAGAYAARIVRGEKPADLPVQQVTKVEMVINLDAARLLGLELPTSLVSRADEVES